MRAPWLSLAVLLGACQWAPVPLEELQQKREEASCRKAVRCGSASSRVDCANLWLNSPWSDTLGVGALETSWRLLRLRDAADAGLVRFDPTAAARCLETYAETSSCLDGWSAPDCAEAFVGSVAEGQPCPDFGACGPGLVCVSAPVSCGGICRAWARVGQPPGNSFCEPGTYTTQLVDGGERCDPPLPVGADCNPCSLTGDPGCTAECAEGSSCRPSFDGGQHCSAIRVQARGEVCSELSPCAPEDLCWPAEAGVLRCLARGDVGEPCEPCLLGLSCKAGLCTPPSFTASCSPGSCGDGGTCDHGHCLFPGPDAGGVDSTCSPWRQDCNDGLFCGYEIGVPSAYFPRCIPRIDAGAPCSARIDGWCSPGQSCRNALDGGRVCEPLLAPCE